MEVEIPEMVEPICLQEEEEFGALEVEMMYATALDIAENVIFPGYKRSTFSGHFSFNNVHNILTEKIASVAVQYGTGRNALSSTRCCSSGNGVINVQYNDGFITVRSRFNGVSFVESPSEEDNCVIARMKNYSDRFTKHFWLMQHGNKNLLLEATENDKGVIDSISAFDVDLDATLDTVFTRHAKRSPILFNRINDYCSVDGDLFCPSYPVKMLEHSNA